MKHFFFILLLISGFASGQTLQPADVGLPPLMNQYDGVHWKTETGTITEVTTVVTKPRFKQTVAFQSGSKVSTVPIAYSWNFIHDRIHEWSMNYEGTSGDTLLFEKKEINFTYNGQSYWIAPSSGKLYPVTGGWCYSEVVKDQKVNVGVQSIINGRIQNSRGKVYSVGEMAMALNASVDQVYNMLATKYYFRPGASNAITSEFTQIKKLSGNNYEGLFYLNREPYTALTTSKIPFWGNGGQEFIYKWTFYNGCSPDGSTYSQGNFGECKFVWTSNPTCTVASGLSFQYGPGQAFVYDGSKLDAVLQFDVRHKPISGKEYSAESYYTFKGCDVDDPCGPARRLPRSPVK